MKEEKAKLVPHCDLSLKIHKISSIIPKNMQKERFLAFICA